jgi:hypothetical protein
MFLRVQAENDAPLVTIAQHLIVDPFYQVGAMRGDEIPQL